MIRISNFLVVIVTLIVGAHCVQANTLQALLSSAQRATRSFFGNQGYHYKACEHLKSAYAAKIAGQDTHLAHIAQTVCRHIKKDHSSRPLVLLITGPPGVGKTWTARVTAQALFANEHLLPIHCEPTQYPCSPFLQISSYSFVIGKEEERLEQLMRRLKDHLQEMPQSLIVFEDFDRFDCALRDFVRDIIEHGPAHGLQWSQSVIILTSNVGAFKAAQIAKERGQDARAWPEHEVQKLVEDHWKLQCRTDDEDLQVDGMVGQARMIKAYHEIVDCILDHHKQVDRFIAYNAMAQRDIEQVFQQLLLLENRQREERRYRYSSPLHERLPIAWDHAVLTHLAQHGMVGGYSSGFARQGASKCGEVLEQVFDLFAEVPCESVDSRFRLRRPRSRSASRVHTDIEIVCEPHEHAPELPEL